MKSNKAAKARAQQLRIIGGQWRGRKLAIANVEGLRPTGDRIRETLFNWLMADISGSTCLDLFAGAGALGLECLSRGAAQVILLEKHPVAAKQLQQHCQQLNATNGHVIQGDSLTWLKSHTLPSKSVNIVFIDPPFSNNLWEDSFKYLQESNILAEDALIYVETPKEYTATTPSHWQLHKEKQAGQVRYQLFTLNDPLVACSL